MTDLPRRLRRFERKGQPVPNPSNAGRDPFAYSDAPSFDPAQSGLDAFENPVRAMDDEPRSSRRHAAHARVEQNERNERPKTEMDVLTTSIVEQAEEEENAILDAIEDEAHALALEKVHRFALENKRMPNPAEIETLTGEVLEIVKTKHPLPERTPVPADVPRERHRRHRRETEEETPTPAPVSAAPAGPAQSELASQMSDLLGGDSENAGANDDEIMSLDDPETGELDDNELLSLEGEGNEKKKKTKKTAP